MLAIVLDSVGAGGEGMTSEATARYNELRSMVDGTHPSIDRSHHVLQHPDGTVARIDPSGIVWVTPDGEEIPDTLLWPPRAYAARLCRKGFQRQGGRR